MKVNALDFEFAGVPEVFGWLHSWCGGNSYLRLEVLQYSNFFPESNTQIHLVNY